MFTRSRRMIQHEILDEQSAESGAASLRDLVRINRFLGGHEATRKALRTIAPQGPFTVLDVGAGSGDSARAIAAAFPKSTVTSLDYKLHHLTTAPFPKLVANAFQLPLREKSFDIVHCSLFLHHFKDEEIVQILVGFAKLARLGVVVNDLERHFLAYWFLPCTRWLLRWDAITVHDGPVSVQAAFLEHELRSLATAAGLRDLKARVYRPAFRIALVGRP